MKQMKNEYTAPCVELYAVDADIVRTSTPEYEAKGAGDSKAFAYFQ